MPKGEQNPRHTGEFKQRVIEDIRETGMSYREAMRKYSIAGKVAIQKGERIYLEEGAGGLYVERRGRGSKRRPLKQAHLAYNAKRQNRRQRIAQMAVFLQGQSGIVAEYDDKLDRRLVGRVTVFEDRLAADFRSGMDVEVSK